MHRECEGLQLKMMERILSIALLEAFESKAKSSDGRGHGEDQASGRISCSQSRR
jgi:hypothetical protein